jgi:hypothetical protein
MKYKVGDMFKAPSNEELSEFGLQLTNGIVYDSIGVFVIPEYFLCKVMVVVEVLNDDSVEIGSSYYKLIIDGRVSQLVTLNELDIDEYLVKIEEENKMKYKTGDIIMIEVLVNYCGQELSDAFDKVKPTQEQIKEMIEMFNRGVRKDDLKRWYELQSKANESEEYKPNIKFNLGDYLDEMKSSCKAFSYLGCSGQEDFKPHKTDKPESKAVKEDQKFKQSDGKLRWSLLTHQFYNELEEIVKVLEFGAGKYPYPPLDNSWRIVRNAKSKYTDAANRHLQAFFGKGEQVADDSKLNHLAHAITDLLIVYKCVNDGICEDEPKYSDFNKDK